MADPVIEAASGDIHNGEDDAVTAASDDVVDASGVDGPTDDTRGGRWIAPAMYSQAANAQASAQATATTTADPDHSGGHTVAPPPDHDPFVQTDTPEPHNEADAPADDRSNPYMVHDDPTEAVDDTPADHSDDGSASE